MTPLETHYTDVVMPPIDPLLLDLPTTMSTERLDLRAPEPGDGAAVYEAVAESLVELRRFLASLPWVAGEPSVQASERFCRQSHAHFIARQDLPFLMFERATHRFVGTVGLHRPNWATPSLEIGFWRRSSARGQGFVSEATSALVEYAFHFAHAQRLTIVTDEDNHASRSVAERCGFQLEGVLRHERRAPDGSLRNTCLYARLRPVA